LEDEEEFIEEKMIKEHSRQKDWKEHLTSECRATFSFLEPQ
jgi:hypothetical protein